MPCSQSPTSPLTLSITVLMENRADDPDLHCEHGLSFWVQSPDASVLFDTGQSGAFVDNATALGVDLHALDALVLSHGHYDHTNGLPRLCNEVPTLPPVFVHPEARRPRFSIKDPLHPKAVGMSDESLRQLDRLTVHPVTAMTGIGRWITCTGPVPRRTDFEDTGGPFYLDPGGTLPDPIVDDQSLILRSSHGLVILLGCAHAGVINILQFAHEHFPDEPIHAILGGFHLLNANPGRLQSTYGELERLNPALLAPCHCTGERPMREMQERFGSSYQDCRTGSRFEFPAGT